MLTCPVAYEIVAKRRRFFIQQFSGFQDIVKLEANKFDLLPRLAHAFFLFSLSPSRSLAVLHRHYLSDLSSC